MAGVIHQLSVSDGGVPKLPIEVGEVTAEGLAGDRQAKPGIHGGPYRALCLFPLEIVEELAAAGHPIGPGGVGENVTTSGLDWSTITPGTRLRLGEGVLIEITGFTDPCKTIAENFTGADINLINQRVAPGKSRVYAQVLEAGSLQSGDAIEVVDVAADGHDVLTPALGGIGQISLPVSDLERSIQFFTEQLGATLVNEVFGLAFFRFGETTLMLDGSEHSTFEGPSSGAVYFDVDDINASYEALRSRGVSFDAAPLMQHREGAVERWRAFFRDPDGNPLGLKSEVAVEG